MIWLTCAAFAASTLGIFLRSSAFAGFELVVWFMAWFCSVYVFIASFAYRLRRSAKSMWIAIAATCVIGLGTNVVLGGALSPYSYPIPQHAVDSENVKNVNSGAVNSVPVNTGPMNCGPPFILLIFLLPIVQWPVAILFERVASKASGPSGERPLRFSEYGVEHTDG